MHDFSNYESCTFKAKKYILDDTENYKTKLKTHTYHQTLPSFFTSANHFNMLLVAKKMDS